MQQCICTRASGGESTLRSLRQLSSACASNMGLGTRTLCRAREHFTFSMIASILDLVTCANLGDLTMAAMRSIRKLALFWAQYLQRTVFALPLWHHKPVPNDPSLEFRGEKGFEQRRALARTLGAVDEWDPLGQTLTHLIQCCGRLRAASWLLVDRIGSCRNI